ncbi:Uncharacterized protein dnl_60160 [Desulfonema limicola]|uniref:Chemotaxis protein n=1 Tax=Desulfonema limicola TaxID=45656 RepID=A0A975BE03_9BACT|nr:hypothetical protein [Desulfonema limicola]QTA83603.1 Uncharacterized protein dnl_60160 [Desulfonema limicola]
MKKLIHTSFCLIMVFCLIIFSCNTCSAQEPSLGEFDLQVKKWAGECKNDIIAEFQKLLDSKILTEFQLFDTFYIPVPGTDPQKYHTQYDSHADKVLQKILDDYLAKDTRLIFVVAVDINGYLPTHNSKYSKPLTGSRDEDFINNRTKRIFNDRTGLAAARNIKPFLIQRYSRDTGEEMADLSIPVFINDRHWGAVRFGYKYK